MNSDKIKAKLTNKRVIIYILTVIFSLAILLVFSFIANDGLHALRLTAAQKPMWQRLKEWVK